MNATLLGLLVAPERNGSSPSGSRRSGRGRLHVHRYHRVGDDVFAGGSLYRCRCGVVRPGV